MGILESASAAIERSRQRETALEQSFVEFLTSEKGYPVESIASDLTLPTGARPDMVIVDPISRRYLAIVEFKPYFEAFKIQKRNWLHELLGYRAAAHDLALPVFLVIPSSPEGEAISIRRPDADYAFQEVSRKDFPTYSTLTTQLRTQDLESSRAARKATVDAVSITSVLLATLVGVLLVSAIANLWVPSWEKLTLIGVFVGLLLLPQVSKLKIAGIEFEKSTASHDVAAGFKKLSQ